MGTTNKKSTVALLVLGVFLSSFGITHALSTYLTVQGGTGTTSPSGILYGDNGATNHVNTVVIGTGLQFSGGTLTNTAPSTFSYPFTTNTNFAQTVSATGTPIWDTAGLMASSSSYFSTTTIYTQDADGFKIVSSATNHNSLLECITVGSCHLSVANNTTGFGTNDGTDYGIDPAGVGRIINHEASGFIIRVNQSTDAFIATTSGAIGLGTSSPYGQLDVATGTIPQLFLSDGTLTSNHYFLRSISNNFYLGTATPLTGATSSVSAITVNGADASTTLQRLTVAVNATSTFNGGINLVNGCFSIANTCIGATGGSASTTLLSDNNTFSGLNRFTNSGTTTFSAGVEVGTKIGFPWFFATSSTATSTIAGNLLVGNTATNYFSGAPIVVSSTTNSYVQVVVQNTSNGNNASSLFAAHNDQGTDAKYFLEAGINSSAYQQASFSSQNTNDSFLNASDAGLVIGTASTTNKDADIRFATGGTASTSIRAVIRQSGFMGIGTTTPNWALQIATGTAPQVVLSDGTLTSNHWYLRSISNNLYIGTASPTTYATSTNPAISITNTGTTFTGNANVTGALTVTTSVTNPIYYGGSAAGSTLTLRSTSGVGIGADAIIFGVASNGATEVGRMNLGGFGLGTTTPRWALNVASSTRPQLALSDGSLTSPAWTFRSISGNLYFATASVTTFSTTTNASLQLDTNGKVNALDVLNGWFGVLSPTRTVVLTTGTTTTWTGTTSAPYNPEVTMTFGGTLRSVQCHLDGSFLGVEIDKNGSAITPSYFVASSTVGTVPITSTTFVNGDRISAKFGTTTTASTLSANCSIRVTETP